MCLTTPPLHLRQRSPRNSATPSNISVAPKARPRVRGRRSRPRSPKWSSSSTTIITTAANKNQSIRLPFVCLPLFFANPQVLRGLTRWTERCYWVSPASMETFTLRDAHLFQSISLKLRRAPVAQDQVHPAGVVEGLQILKVGLLHFGGQTVAMPSQATPVSLRLSLRMDHRQPLHERPARA